MNCRVYHTLPLIAVISGCHSYRYQPAPLSPPAVARTLDSRSLDDPGLRLWMQNSAGFIDPTWPLAHWDLNSLTLAAYYFSPVLDLARAHAAAAEASIQTASMKPNPTVSLGPGYETAPESPFMFGLDFSLPVETAGKRGYRIAQASHFSEASRIQTAEAAWTVRSRVRSTLIDYLFAAQIADALRMQESTQVQYLNLLDERFRAGEISLPEVATARIELTNVRQSLQAAEGQISINRASLASVIGIPVSVLAGKLIEWPQVSTLPSPDALPGDVIRAAAIENRLDVQRDLADYEAAQSALQLEVARQYPDINLGPGYAFEEGAHLLSLQLSSVVPLRNRNQGPIAEAEAARKAAGGQLLSTQSTVLAEIDEAAAQYHSTWSVLEQATQSATQSAEQSRVANDSFNAGESDRLTALSAELQVSIAERSRLEALHQAQIAIGALEDALQRPIGPELVPVLPRTAPR